MASPAQIIANQTNVQSSSGPTSEAGKARSSLNAVKHGLASALKVLPHEDEDDYQEVLEGYIDEFKPDGYHETFLVQQLAQARLRIRRNERLQTLFLAQAAGLAEDACPYDSAILAAMEAKGIDVLAALSRYNLAAERSYYRAHRSLMEAVGHRAKREEKALLDYIYAPLPTRTPKMPVQNEPNFEAPSFRPQPVGAQNDRKSG